MILVFILGECSQALEHVEAVMVIALCKKLVCPPLGGVWEGCV